MAHVLIVDDEVDIRETLQYILEDYGDYQLSEAADGVAGLEQICASDTPLVVILDTLLPKLSGFGVLEAVASDARLASRDAYVMMTVNRERALANIPESMRQRVEIMSSPFNVDVLLTMVARAARRIQRTDDGLDDILNHMLDDR